VVGAERNLLWFKPLRRTYRNCSVWAVAPRCSRWQPLRHVQSYDPGRSDCISILNVQLLLPVGNISRFSLPCRDECSPARRRRLAVPGRASRRGRRRPTAGREPEVQSLEFVNVSFGYSPRDPSVISDISFASNQGESVAFVGGTGSGKSTLAKLVCGLYKPWSGEMRIDGQAVDDFDPAALAGSLALSIKYFPVPRDGARQHQPCGRDPARRQIERRRPRCSHSHVIVKKNEGYQMRRRRGRSNFSAASASVSKLPGPWCATQPARARRGDERARHDYRTANRGKRSRARMRVPGHCTPVVTIR